MATINLIGVPFPKNAPLFASDKKLQKQLFELESHIEMYHDIREIENYITIAINIQENMLKCQKMTINSRDVCDALAAAAVILYARLFNSSQGRSKLIKDNIPSLDITFHEVFMELRDQFIAHQGWEANKHQVFFFQESETSNLRINPFGQTKRIPIWPNFNWEKFNNCTSIIGEFIKKCIDKNCKSIQNSFTDEQIKFLNTISSDELFQYYWEEQPNFQKNPFSSRTKS